MVATILSRLAGYKTYKVEGEIKDALPIATITQFLISVVRIFGNLYEVELKIVYSKVERQSLFYKTHDDVLRRSLYYS